MKVKHYVILFIICLIPFIFYLNKFGFIGADGYYFMLQVCANEPLRDTMPIGQTIFRLMPCSFEYAKLILFGLFFISTLIVAKLGELFHKHGWLAGVFVFLSPLWISEFLKFEDDVFSYPILFGAMYVFLKGVKEKKKRYQAIGVGLAVIGSLTWKGGVFYIFAMSLTFLWGLILSIPIIVWQFKKLFGSIMPSIRVLENYPIVGALYYYGLLVGWLETKREYLPQLAFFFILTIVNQKFVIHAMPLLAIGVVPMWFNIPKYAKGIKLKFKAPQELTKNLMYVILCTMLLFSYIGYVTSIESRWPNQDVWEAIDYSIVMARDSNKSFKNDWSFGYWVMWKGGTPSGYGGWVKNDYPYYTNSIALALDYVNYCTELRRWKTKWRTIVVYDCPSIETAGTWLEGYAECTGEWDWEKTKCKNN
jgi:hypothetical protein